ncbi:hypothetical protein F5146DRAFT_1101453 [Armillaria mellea]|nr:hypothetical protein F5146DRAFT_1101453 [Armillaria mellea]
MIEQEAARRAAELAERQRIEQEAARRAAELAEQLERERQAHADRIRAHQEEAQRAAEHAQRLEKEKQEQEENARTEREAAQRAAQAVNELEEQMRKKEAEIQEALESQKEAESKWHSGIRPVEWPSQEKYEETKRRYYTEGKFHLAITGISGTGKSSLINAFRGIWDDDEGAAMTDIVESTSVVTPYPDPNPDKHFIWFDNSERYNIPTYIVRSKSDVHVKNIIKVKRRGAGARRDPASILHEACKEYITRTQESVRSNLMKNDPPIRSKKFYAVSRDTLTMVVRGEPLEDVLVLNESDLLKDILQDAHSQQRQ